MSVTSTGADFSARAARSPPNPPPMITTCFFMSGRLCALGDRLELREIRPPLVEKGVERLPRLRRAHARGELVHFEPAGLVEVLAQRALEQLLARSERVDRLLRELLRRLRRGLQDGLVRHDCGDQADPLRARGVEPRSKQEQLGGRATTHERGKPVATPCTAATIGLSKPFSAANKRICGLSPGPGGFFTKSSRSLPAVKESPAPWISTTRVASSFAAVSRVSASATYMAVVIAFFFPGRLSCTLRMLPDRSVRTSFIGCLRPLLSAGMTFGESSRSRGNPRSASHRTRV